MNVLDQIVSDYPSWYVVCKPWGDMENKKHGFWFCENKDSSSAEFVIGPILLEEKEYTKIKGRVDSAIMSHKPKFIKFE